MITLRPAAARGRAQFGWLDSRHSFSFGHYYDPQHLGFRDLLVINEDRVSPGAGFEAHGHQNMEIISYVLEGSLEHRDSIGTGSAIRPGEIQRMSAGTGIRHSEFNGSKTEPVHFLQIWIKPAKDGLPPSYEQKSIPSAEGATRLDRIGAPEGGDGAVSVHQDVALFRASLAAGGELRHALAPGRHAWVQVARGSGAVNGREVGAGDGVAISDEASVVLTSPAGAEMLVFDLA